MGYELQSWRRLWTPLPRVWIRSSRQHIALVAALRRASMKVVRCATFEMRLKYIKRVKRCKRRNEIRMSNYYEAANVWWSSSYLFLLGIKPTHFLTVLFKHPVFPEIQTARKTPSAGNWEMIVQIHLSCFELDKCAVKDNECERAVIPVRICSWPVCMCSFFWRESPIL